ncbi:MAG: cytochrome c oxidase assembly protein [Pseudomonadota bacterium]
MAADRAHARNRRTAAVAGGAAAVMVGLAFAAVPAYRAFCQVTGWGGTTQRAEAAPNQVLDRAVTIRFDATTSAGLAWDFAPEQVSQDLPLGKPGLAFYVAENTSDTPVTGRATYNVSPAKAGSYFSKIECFCFTDQTLQPGERVRMPVTYFIDPALNDDRALDEVETITLSYTFFPYEKPEDGAAPIDGSR